MNEPRSLAGRAISAAKWNYIGNFSRVFLQFLIGVVLARLLGPEAFGTVAIAWLMIGIGKLVSDFGFSAALVQRQDLTERDIGFVFSVQLAIGFCLSLAGYFSAAAIASFFNHPTAEPVVAAMAWLFLTNAIGQTTTAVLNRTLRFKFSQSINVATYLVGYLAIGVPLAYYGYGVWSLVLAQITQSVSYVLVLLVASGLRIRPALSPSKGGMFAFGGKVIGANLCSYALLNLDSFVIGRMLGVTQLGLYNRAMTLVGTPNGVIVSSLQAVLFSVTSRQQNDLGEIKKNFLAATEFVAFLCLPLFLTIAVAADSIIVGVYGVSWREASPALVPLALAMPVHAVLAVIGPVLMAINRTELELYAQAAALAISAPLLFFAGTYSLVAVAWAVLAMYLIRWFCLWVSIRTVFAVTGRSMVSAIRMPFVTALPVAGSAAFLDHYLTSFSPIVRLIALVALSACTLLLVLRVLGPRLLTGPLGEQLIAKQQVPLLAQRWLRITR
jgi:O-antigen/teichoic acid export membrane protein